MQVLVFWKHQLTNQNIKRSRNLPIFLLFLEESEEETFRSLICFSEPEAAMATEKKIPFQNEGSKNIICNGNSTDLFFTVCCYVLLPGTEKNAPW